MAVGGRATLLSELRTGSTPAQDLTEHLVDSLLPQEHCLDDWACATSTHWPVVDFGGKIGEVMIPKTIFVCPRLSATLASLIPHVTYCLLGSETAQTLG